MANYLRPEKLAVIRNGIELGLSGRAIARLAGVANNTLRRYLPDVRPFCACGEPAGHRGWCTVRYAASPARQAFHASRHRAPKVIRVERQNLAYPFLASDSGRPEHDLLKRVNAAVPRHWSPEMRADICQDVIVGILCGEFQENNLAPVVKLVARNAFRMHPGKYGPLSLDAEIAGTDGLRLIDTLSEEDSLWARI